MHPSNSPQHQALASYDILASIFDQLETSEEAWYDYDPSTGESTAWYQRHAETERRVTLARSSRVCRAFFSPAVAVLWRNLDCLSPLASAINASSALNTTAQVSVPIHDI